LPPPFPDAPAATAVSAELPLPLLVEDVAAPSAAAAMAASEGTALVPAPSPAAAEDDVEDDGDVEEEGETPASLRVWVRENVCGFDWWVGSGAWHRGFEMRGLHICTLVCMRVYIHTCMHT